MSLILGPRPPTNHELCGVTGHLSEESFVKNGVVQMTLRTSELSLLCGPRGNEG